MTRIKPSQEQASAKIVEFSASTSIWFTLSLFSISIGLIIMLGFVGQCALELPYHLSGKEALATIGDRGVSENNTGPLPVRSAQVTVYYFTQEQPEHITSSQLRAVERLPQDVQDALWSGAQIRVVYVPGKTDQVLPKAVLANAGQEIKSGVLGGSAIALPGIGIAIWLKKTGRLKPWW